MIEVKELGFNYPNEHNPTLSGLSFEIQKGEIFGFLGPSGAGKSTTQKILFKTLKAYSGSVKIEGQQLSELDKSYFEKIGVGFELPNHYLKLTGKENLNLFANFYQHQKKRDINALFEMVDLSEVINKPVESYSKGMKMRLNFIRAIQHDPDILFFDEPTSGLDPINAKKIKQHILNLKTEGKTIFITTHDMHTADELCDTISFIVNGQLVATDTPKNLKNQHGKEATRVELSDGSVEEFPLKDLGENKKFIQFIKQGEISRIHTLEATLEEVFIQITGKSLQG